MVDVNTSSARILLKMRSFCPDHRSVAQIYMDTGLIRPYSVIQWRCQWSGLRGWPSHNMCSRPHLTVKPAKVWAKLAQSRFREKLSPASRIKGKRGEQISWKTVSHERGPRNYRHFAKNRALGRHVREISEMGGKKLGSNMRLRYIRFRDIHDHYIYGVHCSVHSVEEQWDVILFCCYKSVG